MFSIPTRQDILRDFRKWGRKGDTQFQAVRVVSRWIRCGYDLNELPHLLGGLTPHIIEAGKADAAKLNPDHDPVEILNVPLAVVREDEAASEEQIKEFHEDLACALDKAQAPVFQGDFQYGYVVVRISR